MEVLVEEMDSLLDPPSAAPVLLTGLVPCEYTCSQMDWWCFLVQCQQVLVGPHSLDLCKIVKASSRSEQYAFAFL